MDIDDLQGVGLLAAVGIVGREDQDVVSTRHGRRIADGFLVPNTFSASRLPPGRVVEEQVIV